MTIVSTLVVTIGVVAVLFTVAPILVPIALLGYVPIAVVNVRNNRARYQLELELTELQRDRSYLEYLMTERVRGQGDPRLRHRADAASVARRALGDRAWRACTTSCASGWR